MYNNQLNETLQKHNNGELFYTDASKSEERMEIASIRQNLISIFEFPELNSIYTVEAIAVLM